jgi:hypothetical protein
MPSLATRLQPGGRIVLCDDWMTDKDRGLRAREDCLDQFRPGWHIASLHTVAEVAAIAERAGLRLVETWISPRTFAWDAPATASSTWSWAPRSCCPGFATVCSTSRSGPT